jgi:hypothetical protein
LYVPGGSALTEITPADVDSPVYCRFVAKWVAVIFAPEIRAPWGSWTVPEIEPVTMPCPKAEEAQNKVAAINANAATIDQRSGSFIEIS